MALSIGLSSVPSASARARALLGVLVVAAPPDARLVAPLGCAVQPLVHAPEAVESARIGGIGVVDAAVLERECAHARPLARVRGHVGSGHGRELGDRPPAAGFRDRRHVHRVAVAPVFVFAGPLRCCSSVNEMLKSRLKSLPSEDAQGNAHPIRRLYACSFASGARDTAQSMTSWLARWT